MFGVSGCRVWGSGLRAQGLGFRVVLPLPDASCRLFLYPSASLSSFPKLPLPPVRKRRGVVLDLPEVHATSA